MNYKPLIVCNSNLEDDLLQVELLGAKAFGLTKIPFNWTPPFLILTKYFFDVFNSSSIHNAFESISSTEKQLLNDFLFKIRNEKLIIRSNAPYEDINYRGSFKSEIIENNFETIKNKIRDLISLFPKEYVYIIVQKYINIGLTGHFSNERHISKSEKRWLIEDASLNQKQIIAKGTFNPESLIAKNRSDLENKLASVASYLLNKSKNRFHLEWVWDGKQLWIVQVDEIFKEDNFKFSKEIINSKYIQDKGHNLQILISSEKETTEDWKKLTCLTYFKVLNFPYANVYLLKGVDFQISKFDNYVKIKKDLELILNNGPIIVRCDIAKEANRDEYLLPTSNLLTSIDEIIEFLKKAENAFGDLENNKWTFLISNLVPAQCSAMVQAFPYAQRIRIDAIWGYPDGLLYYPHDTYYFYPANNKVISYVNFKNCALFPEITGWEQVNIKGPYDWKKVLNDSEIETISKWSLNIANYLNSEIQLMVLAKIGGKSGEGNCLPWHFTKFEVQPYKETKQFLLNQNKILTIKNETDFNKIENYQYKGILILPETRYLRNSQFLESVAKIAKQYKIPIYFYGSLLGHAYYIMLRAGANVIPISENEPKEKSIIYNKLVRDNIPFIVNQAGGTANIQSFTKNEAVSLLKHKLLEESYEIWNANEKEVQSEIADLLEVVKYLIIYSGYDENKIREIQNIKRKDRGGFENLYLLKNTNIKSLKDNSESDGAIPQLLDSFSGSEKTDKDIFHSKDFNINKVTNEFSFTIPLIPPYTYKKVKQFKTKYGNDFEISLNYEKDKIVLHINLNRATKKDDDQFNLFN